MDELQGAIYAFAFFWGFFLAVFAVGVTVTIVLLFTALTLSPLFVVGLLLGCGVVNGLLEIDRAPTL